MRHRIHPLLLLATLISSCLPQPTPPLATPWAYTDLRGIYAPSQATTVLPGQDLLAVYARRTQDVLEFRLDLLDVSAFNVADIYLAIGSTSGNAAASGEEGRATLPVQLPADIDWDSLVGISADGHIQAVDRQGRDLRGLAVKVQRDSVAGMVTLSLNRHALPGSRLEYGFQFFFTSPGSRVIVDQSAPLSTGGQPPGRAGVLLAFWNTLPAYTPAQAQRRWDGAHTGPLGGRHGLYNLLRAARNRDIPLALLDLKTPTSLAALDYVGGLNLVKDMAAEGLLILPDVFPPLVPQDPIPVPGEALELSVDTSRETARTFGLPSSPFLYAPLDSGMPPSLTESFYRVLFTPRVLELGQASSITAAYRRGAGRLIPIPILLQNSTAAAGDAADSPLLELRRALASAAATASSGTGHWPGMLVLGGDLPESPWGDPGFARAAMDYLLNHPWVQVLGAQDLLQPVLNRGFQTSKTSKQPPGEPQYLEIINALPRELLQAPTNDLAEAARQAYLGLFAPTYPAPPELASLRAHYAGQVEILLSAAGWAAHPSTYTACNLDLDRDGSPECVLSSATVYAVFEAEDGSLSYLFVQHDPSTSGGDQGTSLATRPSTPGINHQLVGPSSQLISGLGVSSDWNTQAGRSADPQVYPGEFFEKPGAGPFQVSLEGKTLVFSSANKDYTKTYQLVPGGVAVEIHSPDPVKLQIPLALDPWLRFSAGWGERYQGQLSNGSWIWSLPSGPQVRVKTSGHLSAHAFTETRDRMGAVEDPNLESPPGHYLPFPLSLVEIGGQGNFSVEIRLLQ